MAADCGAVAAAQAARALSSSSAATVGRFTAWHPRLGAGISSLSLGMETSDPRSLLLAVILVSSARSNADRRRACRNTWFKYATSEDSPLGPAARAALQLRFLVAANGGGGGPDAAAAADAGAAAAGADAAAAASAVDAALAAEQDQHGDLLLAGAPEGYEHLWRKALVALQQLEASGADYSYFVHADDDSLLRLDLLMPLLEASPRERFYWGYIWDGTGNRVTAPIRNPRNKSHMPADQYPLDHYPPFASGCGFALSRDLVQALLAQPLPDYRLLDPPFGIHLCGGERCVLQNPVTPVHDERVRPYRAIPMFDPATIVQHYLRPEEMQPFYNQALEHARGEREAAAAGAAGSSSGGGGGAAGKQQAGGGGGGDGGGGGGGGGAASDLYAQLVSMGLLRR